jgi:peptidylamidoglycolate lyase
MKAFLSYLVLQGFLAALSAAEVKIVHGWLQLPEGETLGQVSGVGVNAQGDVFVFHRGNRPWMADPAQAGPIREPAVWRIDGATGQVKSRWGANTFVLPHGLTIDQRGHVWLTDVGRHQVFEYAADGTLLRTWGEDKVGGNDRTHFNKPTDVAVLADGSFYVSDGYVNSRVVKFSADGQYQFEWGRKGTGPGEFVIPHGIAVDAAGQVYVADRQNDRIQVFTAEGKFIAQWKNAALGRPYGVRIGRDGLIYVADGGEQPAAPPHRSQLAVLTPEGKVVTTFGRWGNFDGQFQMAHDLAIADDGSIYVGDINGQRVQKLRWQGNGGQPAK